MTCTCDEPRPTQQADLNYYCAVCSLRVPDDVCKDMQRAIAQRDRIAAFYKRGRKNHEEDPAVPVRVP